MTERLIGPVVRQRRLKLGITLDKMEEMTGLDQAYLSRVERGVIREPGVRIAARIAMAMEMTVDELLRAADEGNAARLQPAMCAA